MGSVLSFRDVWVEYGEKIVLEKVSLDVADGAFVSIVGPSGAGKSTFLRLVLGQEAPSRGRIFLDGEPLRAEPGPDRGVVFQRYSVFPHMTVLRNVMFGVQCSGRRGSARDEAAEMLQKAHYQDVPLPEFKEQFKASKYYTNAEWRQRYQDGTVTKWLQQVTDFFVATAKIQNAVKASEYFDPKPFLEVVKA